MTFDYGNKKENGQYENYPTNSEGEFVAPIRRTYVHRKCGVATKVSEGIAKTYAKNPKYYSHTFCVGCKDHYPVNQFEWDDGTTVGEIGLSETERKINRLYANRTYYKEEMARLEKKLEEVEDEIEIMQSQRIE